MSNTKGIEKLELEIEKLELGKTKLAREIAIEEIEKIETVKRELENLEKIELVKDMARKGLEKVETEIYRSIYRYIDITYNKVDDEKPFILNLNFHVINRHLKHIDIQIYIYIW